MPGLADKMAKMYGGKDKESPAEDKAEGGESAEGARLGSKFASAVKSGDGEMIYNAFSALKKHCDMKE